MSTSTRRALHLLTHKEPQVLLLALRLLTSRGLEVETGKTFVKFARGEADADAAAAALKQAGLRLVPATDEFSPDTDSNLAERLHAFIAHHEEHGHVHGPGCGHGAPQSAPAEPGQPSTSSQSAPAALSQSAPAEPGQPSQTSHVHGPGCGHHHHGHSH